MDALVTFDSETRDRLAWIVESSLQVRSQSGFFLWTQGAVQYLVPHEILICGVSAGGVPRLRLHWYSATRYFGEQQFRLACQPTGLMMRTMERWSGSGRAQFLPGESPSDELVAELKHFELKNMVADGVTSADGDIAGFYSFSRTSFPDTPNSRGILAAVVASIHVTYCRVLGSAMDRTGTESRIESPLTHREAEILSWIRDGKTTSEIAEILGLSPFTVKNHVQKVLKKLGAKSRSHAVAQAMSQGILLPR